MAHCIYLSISLSLALLFDPFSPPPLRFLLFCLSVSLTLPLSLSFICSYVFSFPSSRLLASSVSLPDPSHFAQDFASPLKKLLSLPCNTLSVFILNRLFISYSLSLSISHSLLFHNVFKTVFSLCSPLFLTIFYINFSPPPPLSPPLSLPLSLSLSPPSIPLSSLVPLLLSYTLYFLPTPLSLSHLLS